jgi:hypothetical protein
MMSSYCRNCGGAISTVGEMSSNWCITCEEARKAAMQFKKEQTPDANESDLLYAGREALMQRRFHPRQTFVNPKDHNAHIRPGR